MAFSGTYTALVTPFREDRIDADAFARLIEEQVAAEIDGIVPAGPTGESPTLDHDEHVEVIRLAVKGMLPRNRLARKQLTKLKVYAGPEHPHAAQQPQPMEIST